jgi:hypothetical protein
MLETARFWAQRRSEEAKGKAPPAECETSFADRDLIAPLSASLLLIVIRILAGRLVCLFSLLARSISDGVYSSY